MKKVKCIVNYNDSELKESITKGKEFEVTEERAETLINAGVCVYAEETKEETVDTEPVEETVEEEKETEPTTEVEIENATIETKDIENAVIKTKAKKK